MDRPLPLVRMSPLRTPLFRTFTTHKTSGDAGSIATQSLPRLWLNWNNELSSAYSGLATSATLY